MLPLDIAKFRAAFPQFADATVYPDPMLNTWWAFANCEIVESCLLHGDCLENALMLCLAHILMLMHNAARGKVGTGAITSAVIDKVQVGFQAPPFTSGWGYWLGLSPYGIALKAMLSIKAAGGFYIGGMPESRAIRRVGGRFR